MFDIEVLLPDLWDILGAVPLTLAMALVIFAFSTIIGSLFAMVEYRRIPVLRQLVVAYKIAFKGVPMVVVIFLAYYGLPSTLQFLTSLVGVEYNGHSMPNWVTLIVALTACVAAFQAEVVKGALNSFDTGQAEAAYSLGYKKSQLFRRVMLPQVIVAAIPDLANSFMVIMKALSLGFAIEVVDIFAQSQLTAALNFYYLEAFLVAVVIYMVIAYVVTQIADRSERALRVRT
ncbi:MULTISPECIES: amino acid ABC transporter permease [unclassified Rhizobium]|jgi:L-cystine transport system permease protein|uniref:amino acid ABC transporter permease n=1 Tax=unclassified Rhizobium TaxID=2613769 RepID=UPI001C83F161|nr:MULTISPECIES: amino acid ABC transporter permease [unclassified Rhizobium]MBX5166010.1 amino acid ABC transporter permease [Rhizobium sp. NZLR4b]MBX5173588.1 amino acid ABC transporter permease [Rhizobium sp. NZLR1b]MBX5209434.1 amino acid ABC transporter permease [Rhizobium sp. NZLR11]